MIRVDAQPTPDGELRRQILSKCVEKSEREWWAARTIEKLEFELNAANEKAQRYHEHILKHKEENALLSALISEQEQTIDELQEVNEYLRQKNDKLEYGRTSK